MDTYDPENKNLVYSTKYPPSSALYNIHIILRYP
uniref:Uncharacterized protein n=1 Tax=viral metagenome TaxID=1070528 RepID=A0A6C0KUQ8_9ZZZZ